MTGRRRRGGSHRTPSGGHTPTRRPDTGGDGSDSSRHSGGRGTGADLDAIDTMAGRLDATRGRVEGVGNTVRGINVGRESMGIIGSGFTGAAQSHLRTAEAHVARTTQAVEAAQRGTRGTAEAYRTQDNTGATSLSSIDTTTHPPTTNPQSNTTPASSTTAGSTPSTPPSIADVLDGKAKNPVGGATPSSTSTPPRTPTPAPPPRMSNDDFLSLPPHRQTEVAEAEVSHGARTFRDNDEAIRYGADNWNDHVDGLPTDQKGSLYNYTTDPPHYPSYVDINGHLRDPVNGPDSPEIRRDIENIDRAMAGHPVPEDIVVSRGTNLHHIPMPAPEMVGKTFNDPAYMSTSLGDTAGAFDGKDAVLHLRVPEGTPALYMEKVSAFGNGERELLLGRDMSYRVDRVVWENNQWQIYGEIIPPK